MPKFTDPSIHRVDRLSANVTECNATAICLSIIFRGADDESAEVEIYFNGPHMPMAQKYADAINAVRA